MNQPVALVTGATRGIGKAIVIQLAKQGFDVVIHYHASHLLAKSVEVECQRLGRQTMLAQCDVRDESAVKQMIKDVLSRFGRIDVLVNNAGITKDGLLVSMTSSDFNEVVDVNLKGTFNVTHLVAKEMMKAKHGSIINVTSIVGIDGNAGQANYAASKAGIIGFTKSVAKELGAFNVRCNAVAPGYIQTDMTDILDESVRLQLLSNIPLKRVGRPQDVANVVAFLASDAADYITGQVLRVDGGKSI